MEVYEIKTLEKIDDSFEKVMFILASISFIGLIFINIIQILSRYVISYSITGNQEISILLVSWTIFLGFSKVVKEKEDISITFLINKLPQRLDKTVNLVLTLLFLIASGWILGATYSYMIVQSGMTTQVLSIPNYLYTLPLFVLMIYVFIHFLIQLTTILIESNNKGGEEN